MPIVERGVECLSQEDSEWWEFEVVLGGVRSGGCGLVGDWREGMQRRVERGGAGE